MTTDNGTRCSVCGRRREKGGTLEVESDEVETAWVCQDCQQMLMRQVDDDVEGG